MHSSRSEKPWSRGVRETHQGLDHALLVSPPAAGTGGGGGLGVLVEQAHSAEGFPAARTAVLLGMQMRLQVGPQVALVGEAAGAEVAGERLLSGVRAHVALQEPRAGEALAASFAPASQDAIRK